MADIEGAADSELVTEQLQHELELLGLECHPLLIRWYNEHVSAAFRLPYDADTLCHVVLSAPDMFEQAFIPWLQRGADSADCSASDPLDTCMRQLIGRGARRAAAFCACAPVALHDFQLTPQRRPVALMQTAAHVSGAVRFFQRGAVEPDAWPAHQRVSGVCLHPRYGGWFAIRALLVFPGITAPQLRPKPAPEIRCSGEEIRRLLDLFNNHWRDGRYRDVIDVVQKYSPLQCLYFSTVPAERGPLVQRIANQDPALFNSANHDPALFNSANHEPAVFNSANHDPALFNSANHEPAVFNSANHEPVLFNSANHDPALFNSANHDPALFNSANHDPALFNSANHNPAFFNSANHNSLLHDGNNREQTTLGLVP